MIRRFFEGLPGPAPVRILITLALLAALAIALHFVYTWMGNTFLDTGGGVG